MHDLAPNSAGNFYYEAPITKPYRATLRYMRGGVQQERPMVSTQTNGSCNSCHTVFGNSGAAGRIAPLP